MEWHRVVEIFAEAINSQGSGYVLAPGLILTARHVVGTASTASVRLLSADDSGLPGGVSEWQAADVVWTGAETLDLALLTSQEPLPLPRLTTPVKIGRLDGRAPVPVDGIGFPAVMADGTKSDTLHVRGMVEAWSGVRSDAILLKVESADVDTLAGWKGLSGGGVFAGDRLVGTLERVPLGMSATLRATPAFGLFEDAKAAAILTSADVATAGQFIDADYVAKLPRAGNWYGVRAEYTHAVLNAFCMVDHIGLAVTGIQDSRVPALRALAGRRLRVDALNPMTQS